MTTETRTSALTPTALIYGMAAAGDPRVSPDGRSIVYSLARVDPASRQGEAQLWVCDIDGGNARQLTHAGTRNGWARWSPDGQSIAFVSDRAGKSGLFVLPLIGGDARQLTTHRNPIGEVAWSPDGGRIAYTVLFDPANPSDEEPPEDAAPCVRVTSRLDYKQDNRGYLGDARSQVYVVDAASGQRTQLTCEPVDHLHPQWSPDGSRLAVAIPKVSGLNAQLSLIDVASGESVIVGSAEGVVSVWSWSPDGARLIFAGDTHQTFQTDFFVYTIATGETRRLTDDLRCLPDGGSTTIAPPAQPLWLDARRVLFHAMEAGASGLYTIDADSGVVERLAGSQSLCSGLSVDAAGTVAVQSYAALDAVGEIVVTDLASGTARVVTGLNRDVFAASPAAEWEAFTVQRGAFSIDAWLLKPPGFDPSTRYPLILDVHGGPNGFYGYTFNAMQQALAGAGFLVVFANPRGSSSYGRDFTSQVFEDWGGEDYLDLMAVVDAVLERPYADAARTGIWGYSYGGYMTAWTIGQSNRFKAAVCGAPCFDLESMYGTSDISYSFGELQWGGPPHRAREWYATHSPSTFAHNIQTPTLIIQGEADERCPVGQGEQMFVALKRSGCETEFARYPGGSHLFMRVGPPEHRADVLTRAVDWFTRHLTRA